MTGWQWLGAVVLVGWAAALLAYGFTRDAWLTRTMLLGSLAGLLVAVPVVVGLALVLGAVP